jgi:hypothetical protein
MSSAQIGLFAAVLFLYEESNKSENISKVNWCIGTLTWVFTTTFFYALMLCLCIGRLHSSICTAKL